MNPSKTSYLLVHHHQSSPFPSESSMRSYVHDFIQAFPDTDVQDMKMFRVEYFELESEVSNG